MATKKKQAAEVVVPFLTTTKKAKEVSKLEISGLEKLAANLRDRHNQIESLEAEQKTEEKTLLDVVKKERISAEKKGEFYKCCLVLSEDENPVRVQFVNKFSKIASENEEVLRECLGSLFDELYVPRTTVKLRDTVSVETLKEKVGEQLYLALFEEENFIAHRDEFMENRARLRMTLNDKTNEVIDQLVNQTAQKPGVSYK